MPSRLPKHLFDALAASRLAREFAAGLSLEAYGSSPLVRSAVERQLEILGEACQRMLSEDAGVRLRVPDIGFAVGLRNRIIHGDDRVENAVVYDTVMRDLPSLERSLEDELARHPAP
jgi:uncharacterized protein with HEPN domain